MWIVARLPLCVVRAMSHTYPSPSVSCRHFALHAGFCVSCGFPFVAARELWTALFWVCALLSLIHYPDAVPLDVRYPVLPFSSKTLAICIAGVSQVCERCLRVHGRMFHWGQLLRSLELRPQLLSMQQGEVRLQALLDGAQVRHSPYVEYPQSVAVVVRRCAQGVAESGGCLAPFSQRLVGLLIGVVRATDTDCPGLCACPVCSTAFSLQ